MGGPGAATEVSRSSVLDAPRTGHPYFGRNFSRGKWGDSMGNSQLRRLAVIAVAIVSFGVVWPQPASAVNTLHSITATTNLGRTCSIVFQGGSPYRTTPVSSYIEYAGSISCNTPGGVDMESLSIDAWFDVPSATASPQRFANYLSANQAATATGGPAGDATSGCSGFSQPNSCSFYSHIYGYPGDAYTLHNHAGLSLPLSTSSSNGERWTSYPSMCNSQILQVRFSGTHRWSSVLECSAADVITAS